MKVKTVYKVDGKEFATIEAANAYISGIDKIKSEVKELLSQILIKLKDIPEAKVENDGDGGYDISNREQIPDIYLSSLKTVVKDIVSGSDYTVESYLTQYYDSSCW